MDNSSKFHAMLDRLRVPEQHRISRDTDVDWMWADNDCAKFLDWITQNIDDRNLVSPVQQKQ